MVESFIITIDGLASSGKSTIAKMLASKLNFYLLESGSLYRLVTYWFLNYFKNQENPLEEIEKLFKEVKIDLTSKGTLIYWKNRFLKEELRSKEVEEWVSKISSLKEVRNFLTSYMRELTWDKNLVAEGRDMGSVVFPWARFKIFLTAKEEIRARRRHGELTLKEKRSYEEILKNLKERDELDSTRKVSPLVIPEGAYLIDTSYLSPEEVLEKILRLIKNYEE
ncbi:MAG: (d)CMP kinase [Thermodesulfobacteriaceae bacterium]|nr:(d)CMP kinase [Thermodesulfobacteriaceae bacterium]